MYDAPVYINIYTPCANESHIIVPAQQPNQFLRAYVQPPLSLLCSYIMNSDDTPFWSLASPETSPHNTGTVLQLGDELNAYNEAGISDAMKVLDAPSQLVDQTLPSMLMEPEEPYSPFSILSVSPPGSPFSTASQSPTPLFISPVGSSRNSPMPINTATTPSPVPVLNRPLNSADVARRSLESSSGKMRRRSGSDSEQAKAARRRKHNELEIRRRKEMNNQFEELHGVLGCQHTRSSILDAALSRICMADQQIKALSAQVSLLKPKPLSKDQQAHSEQERGSEESFAQLYRSSYIAQAILGIDGRILQCNESFTSMTKRSTKDLLGTTIFALVGAGSLPSAYALTNQVLESPKSSFYAELGIKCPSSGDDIPLHSIATALVSGNQASEPYAIVLIASKTRV